MNGKMTLFFNWQKLIQETKSDSIKLVNTLKAFKDKKLLKAGLRDKLKGSSFLLKPDSILNDNNTDILYIHQYIFLAAKRDYSLYKLYGVKSLQLSHYPDINLSSIRSNPLLIVTNNEIHFKYEE
jgi:hypothetical protein